MTTVYFAGGEDTSFILTLFSGGGAVFRSAFARTAISGTGGQISTASFPLGSSAKTPLFGPLSSFWSHARYGQASNATAANSIIMALADAGGVGRILIRISGASGAVAISTRNAAGTVTDLIVSAAGVIPASVNLTVPIDVFCNYAVSGQVQVWIGGILVADTGTGVNVTTDSATALSQLILGSPNSGASSGGVPSWSEVIVQDTSTLGSALQTLPPVAAGATQSWTPNTVGNVNPSLINDVNFVSTSSNNALSEWTVSTSLPAGIWTITAVVQEARVNAGASGPQHFEWLVRTSDGTDHVTGSLAPSTSFANFGGQVWMTNPHTSAAWNAGELINAGIESLA